MTNAISRIVRREIDSARNRSGMQAGLPKVTIEASHAEYLCKMTERIAEMQARERGLAKALEVLILHIEMEILNEDDIEFAKETLAKRKAEIGDE